MEHAPIAHSVVLVTLDGTRWQDIFGSEELMPTLRRWMTTEGIGIGAPGHGEMWASGPHYVSMPGYTEILTGRPSVCQSNECDTIRSATILDEVLDGGDDAFVAASWERIARVASRDPARLEMTTGRTTNERVDAFDARLIGEAKDAGAWPGVDDYRRDELTMRVALSGFDRHVPKLAFVSLGDPDEHAHHGDRERYLASLRAADAFLAELEKRIDDRTVVFVTADHGRSNGFRDHGGGWHESGRVWLGVRAPCIAARGYIDGAQRLADVAPTIRCLLGQRSDDSASAGHAIAAVCATE
jgi:predicted AlkP superfamily pyrophosphatase or phosphodiesterase